MQHYVKPLRKRINGRPEGLRKRAKECERVWNTSTEVRKGVKQWRNDSKMCKKL